MININGNIENILKLPLKIMVALCISSGLILFLPNNIIQKLYMLSFRENFSFILGIIFILSLSIILCTMVVAIANYIINKIRDIIIIIKRNKIIENLDSFEKDLIIRLYKQDDKTLDIPYDSGTAKKLTSWGLISPVHSTNYIDLLDPVVPYFLQPDKFRRF